MTARTRTCLYTWPLRVSLMPVSRAILTHQGIVFDVTPRREMYRTYLGYVSSR